MFGDDTTHLTKCEFPGVDGSTPDCARAFVCASILVPLLVHLCGPALPTGVPSTCPLLHLQLLPASPCSLLTSGALQLHV